MTGCRTRRRCRRSAGVNGETGATVGHGGRERHDAHERRHLRERHLDASRGRPTTTTSRRRRSPTTIDKANATVAVTPYDVTYDGLPHTATVSTITGVNGETGATVGTVDVSDTTHTNAGTLRQPTPGRFTGTANYNDIAATTITDDDRQGERDGGGDAVRRDV